MAINASFVIDRRHISNAFRHESSLKPFIICLLLCPLLLMVINDGAIEFCLSTVQFVSICKAIVCWYKLNPDGKQ